MSTLAYAAFTTSREAAAPSTSTSTSPPGVGTYVDALSALVPAEALTLHALIISVTTKTAAIKPELPKTEISAPDTLYWAFWALLATCVALYVAPRLLAKKWDSLDYVRMLIPALSFVAWTMLQRATAFDALNVFAGFPEWENAGRTVVGLFLGLVLGFVAAALAYKADQKP